MCGDGTFSLFAQQKHALSQLNTIVPGLVSPPPADDVAHRDRIAHAFTCFPRPFLIPKWRGRQGLHCGTTISVHPMPGMLRPSDTRKPF
eukprot:m.27366 g.27366  ORF g.27366 m.27366 type:complete len:89 (-) comp13414_c0_seq2:1286-1552(-)